MTIDTRDPNTSIPELMLNAIEQDTVDRLALANEQDKSKTIEEWRADKKRLDEGNNAHAILGCVGEPLADWLGRNVPLDTLRDDAAKSLLAACEEARDSLLQMVNEHRESAAVQATESIREHLEQLDCSDLNHELCTSDSLEDAADKAFQHAACQVDTLGLWGIELDGWEQL